MTSEALHQSIAAALIGANMSFTTEVGKSGGEEVRLYRLLFGLQSGGSCAVTAYTTGGVLIATTPLRLLRGATRSSVNDLITTLVPMVRIQPNPPNHTAGGALVWVEASVPIARDPREPIPAWLATAPFMYVAAGADMALEKFKGDIAAELDPDAGIPVYTAMEGRPSTPQELRPGASPGKWHIAAQLKPGHLIVTPSDDPRLKHVSVVRYEGSTIQVIGNGSSRTATADMLHGEVIPKGFPVDVELANRGPADSTLTVNVEWKEGPGDKHLLELEAAEAQRRG